MLHIFGPSAFSVQVSTSSTGYRKTFSKIKVIHEATKRACPPKRPFAPRMRMDQDSPGVYTPGVAGRNDGRGDWFRHPEGASGGCRALGARGSDGPAHGRPLLWHRRSDRLVPGS